MYSTIKVSNMYIFIQGFVFCESGVTCVRQAKWQAKWFNTFKPGRVANPYPLPMGSTRVPS